MPDYIQDPNDSNKQIPGPKTDQHFDRASATQRLVPHKSPHYILVNSTLTDGVGFFFGNSASFADKARDEGTLQGGISAVAHVVATGSLTGSEHYTKMLEDATTGTTLHISPTAFSSSLADKDKIVFVYRGGLDGLGRP
jgi:hypothetical protein